MSTRVSPLERIRADIDDLFAADRDLGTRPPPGLSPSSARSRGGTDEAFASRLLGVGVRRTNALESLVIAGFVRGLSVRDVKAALAEASAPKPRCQSGR